MKWEAGAKVDFKKSAGMGGWQPGTIAEVGARSYTVTDSRGGRYVVKPSHVRARREEPAKRVRLQPLSVRAAKVSEAQCVCVGAETAYNLNPAGHAVNCPLWGTSIPNRHTPGFTGFQAPTPRTISARDRSATMQAPIVSRPKARKPTRSEDYKGFIRRHACCVCGEQDDSGQEAHHFGPRAMSEKATDLTCVPLCNRCHCEFHTKGTCSSSFRAAYNRTETERIFFKAQAECLIEWLERGE